MVKQMNKSSIIPKPVTEYDLRLLRIFKAVVENGGFGVISENYARKKDHPHAHCT